MSTVLQLKNITKTYGDMRALSGIDLALPGDAYISLLGPSGSGKTTLLRVIAGFEHPDGGAILFDGKRIDTVAPHQRGIGFVFQNFALFPHLSVAQNIAFGLENRDVDPVTDRRVVDARVRDIISLVGLSGLEGRAVTQISGGQRQRVALARTLVTEPRMVLLDEPLGALDANLRARMRAELRAIRERCGVTFLHVTGSEAEALAMGDTVLVLESGRIAQSADSDTVYNRPASPAVARFLNCYNLFPGRIEGGTFVGGVGRFALGSGAPTRAASPAYAIRYDRVAVRPREAATAEDEIRIEANFVASEYSGAAVNSFFALDDGRVFEVESHLSHAAPETYAEQGRYALVWKREDALVYA
ncbi:Spermidine/putrescine import ATP-binding protein PotA [Ensifer sp. M14]|jgi:ABC-type Fe3+/spermidine/putrescine transport system ATPase subunit|uniref:ABC transporter ATP-binding protein n=1 Tax=Sinorhizobium/Ensifer group TaxID=227292 RepID=UPI000987CDA0|nr:MULTISPECIES: ABC transporter ATP-binding protein [Sinorhizobium/Ensifer group]OOG70953.1 ABC transporter ATP-binding protein [Sinorhizobium sp. A49]RDL48656.1 Spermidine/putrescine import ATP-binding protein PotA [Ensifer sp. M14]